MTPHYFILGLFALAGTISLLASLLNWEWFFTAHNAQVVVRRIGRTRARIVYGVLGLLLIGMAVFFFHSLGL
jgi:small neutral amino acid transporter SnatA (MarC family)